MNNLKKLKIAYATAFVLLPIALSGCNTVGGVGADIGRAGQAIERSASR